MDREAWDKRYADSELLWGARANQFLVREVESLVPGRALDLAAGEGRNAVWLAEQGWQVVAVDFSRVAIDRGRQLAQKRGVEVAWAVADVCEYLPEPLAFDLVALLYLHLPWPKMRVALGHAASGVKPGGTFLLVGHDRINLEQGYGGPQDPAVLYTPDEVAHELGEFVVEKAERVQRRVVTSAQPHRPAAASGGAEGSLEEKIAIDVLVRALRPLA